MEEHVLKVSGMTCEGCEQRIRAALAAEIRDMVVWAGYEVAR